MPPCSSDASPSSSRLLTRGKGRSGTSTPRKAQSGYQPIFGWKSSKRSAGRLSTSLFRFTYQSVMKARSVTPVTEGRKHRAVHHDLDGRTGKRCKHTLREDRLAYGIEPAVRITRGQHDLRIGIVRCEYTLIAGGRVIGAGRETIEDCIPIRLAAYHVEPQRDLLAGNWRRLRSCDGTARSRASPARNSSRMWRCGQALRQSLPVPCLVPQ